MLLFFGLVLLTKKNELLPIDTQKKIINYLNILKETNKHFINVFGAHEDRQYPQIFVITNNATYVFEFGKDSHSFCKPKQVKIARNKKIIHIAPGEHNTLFLTRKKEIISTQLTLEDKTPIQLDLFLKGKEFIHMEAKRYSNFFVDNEYRVYSCGAEHCYQLGHGDNKNQLTPKRIEFFVKNNIKIVYVKTNGYFTYFVAKNGKTYMCGTTTKHSIEAPILLNGFSFASLVKPSGDLLERFEYLTKVIKPQRLLL